MRDVLNGVGGSSSLIVRARGISFAILAQQPGLHRVARDRRVVLHDDLDVDGLGQRMKVTQHGVRVQLRHARRADHHGRRPGLFRVPAVVDARPGAFGGRARHDADPAGHLAGHDLEHAAALRVVETRHFAGDAKRRHAVDARADEQIDHTPQAGIVQIASRRERRGEHRVYAFELHALPPDRRRTLDS